MKRILLAIGIAVCGLSACHGQVPPTTSNVTLTIQPPSGCTGCTFVISRASVASASTACPGTTGTSYSPLNASSPISGTSYTDSTPPAFPCYIAQTEQSGLVSVPSNVVGPETVPAQPTAPGLSGNVVGDNKVPQIQPVFGYRKDVPVVAYAAPAPVLSVRRVTRP